MSYFILGSSSYLGKKIIHYLQKKELPVVGISRNINKDLSCEQLLLDENFNISNLIDTNQKGYVFNCLNSYYKNPTEGQVFEMTKINFDLPKKLIDEVYTNELNLKLINFSSYFNFIDPPPESLEYQISKKKLTNYICESEFNGNIKEIIISDVFGTSDMRNKIFNIILKNRLQKKEISFSNPGNFVNLIFVEKLVEFVFQFLHNENTSSSFLNKYSIQVGLLDELIENILNENEVAFENYFTVESRFDSSKANYGDTILADITDTVVNENHKSNKFHGGRID
jgi:nucleoside-diphosphate-sugar epimerase